MAIRILLLMILSAGIGPMHRPARAAGSVGADERIKVVATSPVLTDLVRQIGRDRVTVDNLLGGLNSEQTATPKPPDLTAVGKARMLVRIGLGLDVWADGLIKNADNRRLLIVTTSTGVALLKKKEHDDGSFLLGNPHIWLDPENVELMVRHITEGLLKIDPAHKDIYMKNQAQYIQDLDRTQQRLMTKLKPLLNRKLVTHHTNWAYFARRFGFTIRGNIASQTGNNPSKKHLADLARTIKTERIRVIVSEPQLNPELPQILAQETGAKVVFLTPIPGTVPGTETYRSMIEYDVNQLIDALKD